MHHGNKHVTNNTVKTRMDRIRRQIVRDYKEQDEVYLRERDPGRSKKKGIESRQASSKLV